MSQALGSRGGFRDRMGIGVVTVVLVVGQSSITLTISRLRQAPDPRTSTLVKLGRNFCRFIRSSRSTGTPLASRCLMTPFLGRVCHTGGWLQQTSLSATQTHGLHVWPITPIHTAIIIIIIIIIVTDFSGIIIRHGNIKI